MAIRLTVASGETVVFPTPPGVNEKRIVAALERLNEVRGISINSAGRMLSPKEVKHFVWLANELVSLKMSAKKKPGPAMMASGHSPECEVYRDEPCTCGEST